MQHPGTFTTWNAPGQIVHEDFHFRFEPHSDLVWVGGIPAYSGDRRVDWDALDKIDLRAEAGSSQQVVRQASCIHFVPRPHVVRGNILTVV